MRLTHFFSAWCLSSAMAWSADTVSFEKDVRPILKAHCFHCHGEDGETKGGLDVRLRRFLEKGGESGPAIVAGKAAESHLLEMITSGEMPKGKPKLPEKDIATIERWIAAGAPTLRPEPEKLGPEHQFTDEERSLWSLQPIARPAIPAIDAGSAHPIDAFIAAKLSEKQLSFSPEADPETLIRRASFDLTGLPPTPEEVESFVAASSADPAAAWQALLDRLLASPAYGERWGRHWLDIAGYADSDGFTEKDPERKYAYKYRDYVVRSMNDDKPFDQFVREQVAGDEIALKLGLHADSPTPAERERYAELLTATGFLRMAPDGTATQNDLLTRHASIAATMKIVGTTLYGLTIACAECHDHRYDPISQADYYRLRAVFDPGFDVKTWRTPPGRLVSLQTKEAKAEAAKIEAEAKKIDDARLVKQAAFIDEVLEKELAKRDASIRDALRTAYKTVAKDRTPEQVKLLKDNPSVNSLSAGSLYLYDTTYKTKHADTLKQMADEAAAVRATKPVEEFVHAFTEVPKAPEAVVASHVLHRGDPESPKDPVGPGELSVLAGSRPVEIAAEDPALPTTGRRLAYAEAITDGSHPLLARVLVNRVWMHHFGKGLVASAADFGVLGEKPSHPELLDWLASQFMARGWSLKDLHRTILSSRTWRQQSRRDPERERIDPDNRLLSRQNVRRLEAETLRDSLLAVSGKLNAAVGGAPVPVMYNEEGQVVIGVDTTDTAGRQTGKFIPLNGEEYRRSVYVQVRRTRPLEMFAAFDAPSMTDPNCEIRPVTTVSPQSLLLMNNTGMREHAQAFATRLIAECGTDPARQAERAWWLSYGRRPAPDDVKAAVEFIQAQTEHYRTHPAKLDRVSGPAEKDNAAPELMGLAALCHALMSANGFLYVD
ncbi:MAG: PSD1 domain-containing protein [Verrucomicrobiales bacterium]|nr:PSD1 domain-containing protein [Verrucomicrobiales bacterium]